MLIGQSPKKTNKFFNKALHNLKWFFFGVYNKLPRKRFLNSIFSCSICRSKPLDNDDFYTSFLNVWESDLANAACKRRKRSEGTLLEQIQEDQEMEKQEKIPRGSSCSWKSEERYEPRNVKETDHETLANKMRELDTIDVGDIEHALDVEEALHYYSRLRSPVYLDIVDRFFTEMYSDLSFPEASSVRSRNRKRNFGSVRF